MGNIFSGATAVKAIMSVPDDKSVISFGNSSVTIGEGFMVDQYGVNWARPVQFRYPMNMLGRVAIEGIGNGTLTLSGLIGGAKDFESLLTAIGNTTVCTATNCVISANSGFKYCTDTGSEGTSDATVYITCSSIILAQFTLGGTRTENGISMQQAGLTFMIGGVKVESTQTT